MMKNPKKVGSDSKAPREVIGFGRLVVFRSAIESHVGDVPMIIRPHPSMVYEEVQLRGIQIRHIVQS